MSTSMLQSASAIDNFGNFYRTWLERQQGFLDELINDDDRNEEGKLGLINGVLSHYKLYHEELFKAAGEDVFLVFSGQWLTSYERTLLWISGFKPLIVFRLVEAAVKDLTAEQGGRVEEMKADVRRREKELTEALVGLQERVAAPPIVVQVNGEISEMESAIEELKMGMLGIFHGAELLRGSTMKRVMEILRSDQTVALLAAATEYQLRIRRWGLQKDLQRTRGPATTTTT